MNAGFWSTLPRPFTVLAPMANVTDWAFRSIVKQCGRPDVFYTEFVSCDGIVHNTQRFAKELYFEPAERPIVVQFFGSKPEHFYQCAQYAQEWGFDGIDINMGCPDRSVEKQKAGAALIKNPKLARTIIAETIRGAGLLPVSVKTRLGYNAIQTDEWIPQLLDTDIAALIIHGRTRKEMSSVPAHWDEIGRIATMAKRAGKIIVGNGDIVTRDDIREKSRTYGVDGVMAGRGIFADPWLFRDSPHTPTPAERLTLLLNHLGFFETLWGSDKNFDTLKRFFKIYVHGWDGAKDLRTQLMLTKHPKDVRHVVTHYQTGHLHI